MVMIDIDIICMFAVIGRHYIRAVNLKQGIGS